MSDHNIPSDATHYFLWWTGIHVYKKEKGVWMCWNGKQWKEELDLPYYKIKWFFGYYLHAGDCKHRLHKISKGPWVIKPLKLSMWNAVEYKEEFHTKIHCHCLWRLIGVYK